MREWIEAEVLHLGAEAEVVSGTWFGRPAVMKKRRPRGWRHPDLDRRLTSKRMVNEIKLTIQLARLGAPVPAIWDVDLEDSVIIMERIDSTPLIDVLRNEDFDDNLLISVGKSIRELHRNAVCHGDLSTNNILINLNNEPVIIDLGLATRQYDVEGFGIDLHVLHEIFRASHPEVKDAMDLVLKGYSELDKEIGQPEEAPGGMPPTADEVIKRLGQIMTRVRYHGG
tara:strand:+ start:12337 stop:13014 length:678 start_codon:yes stop_codon:yes gene_type:complete